MTVIELKERLIAKIQETDDEEILEHISDLFEYVYREEEIHVMSQGEVDAVKEGLAQIDRGEWITNEEANNRVEEWLKK